jgi:hypothetical protein
MKKLLAGFMAFALMSMPAMAITDVSDKYWAAKEINAVVKDKIMTVNSEGKFMPEAKMTRIEFVNALLVVLANENLDVTTKNTFIDVTTSTPYYKNILRSKQMGLVYGYPDKTFKPNNQMKRAETQSVVSHITVDKVTDTSVLKNFKDYQEIPAWATMPYAKSIHHGIYVNYPDAKELRPNDMLTRAEAAVLLASLKEKIALVKSQYCGAERVFATEHLNINKKAPNNEVKITNTKNIILAGNVLQVEFEKAFKSKDHKAGDIVYFENDDPIYTVEGTLLIPDDSVFEAKVLEIKDPQWFNKNARVYMQLNKVTFPDGKTTALNAKPFYKDYALKEGWWMSAGKVALSTVAGAVVGSGAGVGIAFIPSPELPGKGVAIGAPVGAAVGLVTGLVTPGLNYNAREDEQIYVILIEDANILKP